MKWLICTLIIVVVVPAASAQTKEEAKLIKKVLKEATALGVDRCTLNDGSEAWLMPNKESLGKLPVYRCTADDRFDNKSVSYTQIPDGAIKGEIVEFCKYTERTATCETVGADRPARRTADLAKYGVMEHQFEPIVCHYTSVGTLPLKSCSKPREKQPAKK